MGIDRYFEEQEEYTPEWLLLREFDAIMRDLRNRGIDYPESLNILWLKVMEELQNE